MSSRGPLVVLVILALGLAMAPAGAGGAGTGVNDCGDGDGGHQLTWSPTALWPPNHKWQTVTIVYTDEERTHDLSLEITKVAHDEILENGMEMVGAGHTEKDWNVTDPGGTGKARVDAAVQIRSERSGRGDGRTYTISYTATSKDENGDQDNDCSGSATVKVPHDCRAGACVDIPRP